MESSSERLQMFWSILDLLCVWNPVEDMAVWNSGPLVGGLLLLVDESLCPGQLMLCAAVLDHVLGLEMNIIAAWPSKYQHALEMHSDVVVECWCNEHEYEQKGQ